MIRNLVCKIVKELALAKDSTAYRHVRECNCYTKLWCKQRMVVSSERRKDKLSKLDNNNKENAS